MAVTIDGRAVARTVLVVCVSFEILFVLLDYHVNFGRFTDVGAIRRLTNIAREDSLASWFGTAQTLLIGLTGWAYWGVARAGGQQRWRRHGWLLVACLFTYMAIDDGAQLHERIGTAFSFATVRGGGTFPSFAWQLLFLPILGLAGVGVLLFFWIELRATSARFAVAAAFALLVVAVGLDFIEGLAVDHPWNVYVHLVTRYDLTQFTDARFGQAPFQTVLHFSRSLEESLEMLANTCIWTAMLGHFRVLTPSLSIQAVG